MSCNIVITYNFELHKSQNVDADLSVYFLIKYQLLCDSQMRHLKSDL